MPTRESDISGGKPFSIQSALPHSKRSGSFDSVTSFLKRAVSLTLLVALHTSPTPAQAKTSIASDRFARHVARDLEIAKRFAPVFYQSLGNDARGDYITNFDFDGDWNGANNWKHCGEKRYPLKAYVYYAVSETETHYFIHYAVFHPRDYKGGQLGSALLRAGRDIYERYRERIGDVPLVQEAVLSHENDMEGTLVIASKNGSDLRNSRVVAVETLAHNRFLKYVPTGTSARGAEVVRLEGEAHPMIFIEAKGHGQKNFTGEANAVKNERGKIFYYYRGVAEDPEKVKAERVGYDLLPVYTTLWTRAQIAQANDTYGEVFDYGTIASASLASNEGDKPLEIQLGTLGAAFRGETEGKDKALPPWGWIDMLDESIKKGEWFFDPNSVFKKHFPALARNASPRYVHQPFLNIFRSNSK